MLSVKCSMTESGRSRRGYCSFTSEPEEFQRLKSMWKLEPDLKAGQPDLRDVMESRFNNGCASIGPDFGRRAIRYVPRDLLPPMPGNTRTSFNRLLYEPGSKTVCIDLEYPYG